MAEGKTLTVCDTATDDFTVNDDKGYGILSATGTTAAKDGYVVREETNGKSYHRRELKLDNVVLRPSAAGIYYTGQFGLNELYRGDVESYGVVLSLNPEPELDKAGCIHSALTAWPESGAGYGTVLTGIMTKDGGYRATSATPKLRSTVWLTSGTPTARWSIPTLPSAPCGMSWRPPTPSGTP